MEEIKIRKMRAQDFEIIMKIFNETDFGCVGIKEMLKPGKQEQMMMMREVLRGVVTDEHILVIEKSGKVVGYATLQETSNTWHIGQLVIMSDYRGKGIGKKFMKKIKEMAKTCKKNILLECYEENNTFFLKQGFRKMREDEIETEYKWDYPREKLEDLKINKEEEGR